MRRGLTGRVEDQRHHTRRDVECDAVSSAWAVHEVVTAPPPIHSRLVYVRVFDGGSG